MGAVEFDHELVDLAQVLAHVELLLDQHRPDDVLHVVHRHEHAIAPVCLGIAIANLHGLVAAHRRA